MKQWLWRKRWRLMFRLRLHNILFLYIGTMPRSNSSNRSAGETITADRLQDINQDIDDLYTNGNDRVRVAVISGLQIQVFPGAFRVWNVNGQFAWSVNTLTDNAVNYISLTSAGLINISTVWRNANNANVSKVTTASWSVTAIEQRKPDVFGWLFWTGFRSFSSPVYDMYWKLTSFVWDWTSYSLTYHSPSGKVASVSNGVNTRTMTYSNTDRSLVSIVES